MPDVGKDVSPYLGENHPVLFLGNGAAGSIVDMSLNPLVTALKPSKTMALTDAARSMKEAGIDVRID